MEDIMTGKQYDCVMNFISSKKHGVAALRIASAALTYGAAIAYASTALILLFKRDRRFIKVTVFPAVEFVLLSFFRAKINAPRPYQKYGFRPLLPKETIGKSFPSRHVFSIFACAGAIGYVFPVAGAVVYVMGFFLAAIRVAAGVHFPRDVAAGAILAILFNILFFV